MLVQCVCGCGGCGVSAACLAVVGSGEWVVNCLAGVWDVMGW